MEGLSHTVISVEPERVLFAWNPRVNCETPDSQHWRS